MTTINDIDTPALLIDLDILERNLTRMADVVRCSAIRLRPHVKTHKSPLVAKRQMELGACGVCCAKVAEAEVMVEGGVPDVLITTEVAAPEKIRRLVAMSAKAKVAVVADSAENIRDLSAAAAASGVALDVLVEVNVGQNRCGVGPGPVAAALADEIVRLPGLRFRGMQGYHGALQQVVDLDERTAAIRKALDLLRETADLVSRRGHAVEVLTGGGTGSSATDVALAGLTELQPGSYVFMDSTYRRIHWDGGRPVPFESALSVLTSVVSCTARDRIVVDAGWKSLSCDSGMPAVKTIAAATFTFAGDEHGKLALPDGVSVRAGDKIEIIPSHCDTTVNLYDQYVCVRGGKVEAVWPVAARGRTQ
jgi:D-serine deaminase-like pyridoxal phosphate-dependent protein